MHKLPAKMLMLNKVNIYICLNVGVYIIVIKIIYIDDNQMILKNELLTQIEINKEIRINDSDEFPPIQQLISRSN